MVSNEFPQAGGHPRKARNVSTFDGGGILLMAPRLEGDGLIPVPLMVIPRNSCLAAPKIHLAKLTDRPAASSRLSTFSVEVRCSFQVTLAIRMSSSQLATSSCGSLRACRTIRVNADSRTVRPYPALVF